ncbi:hypothetical protein EIMP300_13140 [Escherichia coli]|uniref:Oligopeptide transport permease C-like N-terminal domain-containing protein n=1 Tax=Escherichia coli TaxID=562 RepID=A0A8S0FJ97_ECOLX|nr:hypothetical protein EIMP300_13140 [Escherichia coli]
MSQVTENKVISAPVPMTPLQEFWHYFKRNKGAVVGLVYVVIVLFIAIFANWIAPYNPAEQFRDALLAPPAWQEGGSMAHLLGTDDVGRDVLSRLMYGARLSLLVGCLVVVLSTPDRRRNLCCRRSDRTATASETDDYGRYSRPDRWLLWRSGR